MDNRNLQGTYMGTAFFPFREEWSALLLVVVRGDVDLAVRVAVDSLDGVAATLTAAGTVPAKL